MSPKDVKFVWGLTRLSAEQRRRSSHLQDNGFDFGSHDGLTAEEHEMLLHRSEILLSCQDFDCHPALETA